MSKTKAAPAAANVEPADPNNVEFHPLANRYPLADDEKITQLAADIKENGQDKPIWLFDGKILDGRNRYRACKQAGIEPWYKQYVGDKPALFAARQNLMRMHYDADQRYNLIRELAAEGNSTRTIAALTGWGLATIHRALNIQEGETVREMEARLGHEPNRTLEQPAAAPAETLTVPAVSNQAAGSDAVPRGTLPSNSGDGQAELEVCTGTTAELPVQIAPATKDFFGQPVPPELREVFATGHAWRKLARQLDGMATAARTQAAALAPTEIEEFVAGESGLAVDLETIAVEFGEKAPTAICPRCGGYPTQGECGTVGKDAICGGRGWFTAGQYHDLAQADKDHAERFRTPKAAA